MSDLEDDLLALAGGDDDFQSESDSETVAPSKRSKSVDVNEEDDEDEVLSKKRRVDTSDVEAAYEEDEEEEEEEEEEEDDDEQDDLVNPYPLEGKYKNEQDREDLESMDEIQREQILFERTQEMERYNEKKYLQQRMKQQKKLKTAAPAKGSRSSNRTKDSTNKSSKRDKLSELRKQREQKSQRQTRKYDDYEEDEDEDDEDEELLRDDEEDYDEDIVSWGGASRSKPRRSTELAKVENINKISVGRSKLSKYCFYSDFSEVIVDCYAKVNLGIDKRSRKPLYRMVKIIDVESRPEKAYKLNTFMCDLFLVVSQNKKQTKDFPLSIFSDSSISHEEFDRYLHELEKTGETIDYVDDVNDKYDQLQAFFNRGLSDKDVNEMISRKQKLQGRDELSGYDAVTRKARLMDELKIAKQQANPQKAREIIDKLKKLDSMLLNQTTHNPSLSANVMSKVNERNRKLNLTNIRKAEIKSRNTATVTDGGDPFSRLKTTTRIFYQDLINQENEKAINDAKAKYQELLDEKSKQEEKIAKSTYREFGEMDKLIKSIDIDLEIVI